MKVEVVAKVATLKNSWHWTINLKIILKTLKSILDIIDFEKKLIQFFQKYFSTVNEVWNLNLLNRFSSLDSCNCCENGLKNFFFPFNSSYMKKKKMIENDTSIISYYQRANWSQDGKKNCWYSTAVHRNAMKDGWHKAPKQKKGVGKGRKEGRRKWRARVCDWTRQRCLMS